MFMKKKSLITFLSTGLFVAGMLMAGCTKEGPAGRDGVDGHDGAAGADGTTECIKCHSPESVMKVAAQYELSKHHYGEEAESLAGNAACAPCHLSEAFKYVVENNIPSTFTLNTTTNRYASDFVATSTTAYGEINCTTCHNSIHTTYTVNDYALTTTAPVSMTMWGGAKTIDLPADGGMSNLCVKCHQPRALARLDGNVLDYAALIANPTGIVYEPAQGAIIQLRPAYRSHVHYGTAGAIFAGVGGVEFGSGYTNTVHTAIASCQDCHMAEMNGRSGGHTFFAAGNFKGCNQDGCHTGVDASSASFWTGPRNDIKSLLDQLAAKLTHNGVEMLNRNPDATHNLWYNNTTNRYDGYLNVYDPINNPSGPETNPGGIFRNPSPGATWTQAQRDFNATLPTITITNAQMGAIINFQLVLRDYSLGIHNYKYAKKLLENSLAVI